MAMAIYGRIARDVATTQATKQEKPNLSQEPGLALRIKAFVISTFFDRDAHVNRLVRELVDRATIIVNAPTSEGLDISTDGKIASLLRECRAFNVDERRTGIYIANIKKSESIAPLQTTLSEPIASLQKFLDALKTNRDERLGFIQNAKRELSSLQGRDPDQLLDRIEKTKRAVQILDQKIARIQEELNRLTFRT